MRHLLSISVIALLAVGCAQWNAAVSLANELLTARPPDRTRGALFFHSASIESPRTRTARIGNHVFYQ